MRRRVPDERTAIFTIRLTPTERAAVARAARKYGAPNDSGWARDALLDLATKPTQLPRWI